MINQNMKNSIKGILAVGAVAILIGLTDCGQPIVDPFDPEEQYAIDEEIIEAYLADKGYTDYDTLDSGVRVVILDEGDGEAIEYDDNISYHYYGSFTNDTLFDASVALPLFQQDTSAAIGDVVFETDDDDELVLDVNGLPRIETIEYREGYLTAYNRTRVYQPSITTHTEGGWFIQTSGFIQGFKDGVHYTLENVNINGQTLLLLPSSLAYGNSPNAGVLRNQVLLFELHPVDKK